MDGQTDRRTDGRAGGNRARSESACRVQGELAITAAAASLAPAAANESALATGNHQQALRASERARRLSPALGFFGRAARLADERLAGTRNYRCRCQFYFGGANSERNYRLNPLCVCVLVRVLTLPFWFGKRLRVAQRTSSRRHTNEARRESGSIAGALVAGARCRRRDC